MSGHQMWLYQPAAFATISRAFFERARLSEESGIENRERYPPFRFCLCHQSIIGEGKPRPENPVGVRLQAAFPDDGFRGTQSSTLGKRYFGAVASAFISASINSVRASLSRLALIVPLVAMMRLGTLTCVSTAVRVRCVSPWSNLS